MGKALIYVTARHPLRVYRDEIPKAKDSFTSSGTFHGSASMGSEIANYALEHGWHIGIKMVGPVMSVTRISR